MTFARPQRQKRWPPAGQAPVTSPLGEFAATAFALAAGLVVLTALMPGAGAGPTVAAVLFFAVGAAVAGRALGRSYPHDHLGFCNGITLGRLALTAALVAPLLAGAGASWAVFAVAVIALSLDGFDGWLARRQGYVSDFGARFDMEVDSMLALVLATSAAIASGAGAIAILLGLPRYLFAVAGWVSAVDASRPARAVQPQTRLRGAARRADRVAGPDPARRPRGGRWCRWWRWSLHGPSRST